MRFETFRVGMHLRVISPDDIVAAPNWTAEARARLLAFKQQALPEDVVYHYDSDQADWDRMMGSEGYVVVRGDEIVANFVRRMN